MQNTIIFKSAIGPNNSIYTDALMIRKVVFVDEQQVPVAEEVDQYDQTANHFVGYDGDKPICCARILHQDGEWFLGRIAVLKNYRHYHVGTLLLQMLLNYVEITHQTTVVRLFAQSPVVGFYEKIGFIKNGQSFIDANIVHFPMIYYYN